MMTTKEATKIANNLPAGFNDTDLYLSLSETDREFNEKEIGAIVNAYRQRPAIDTDDLMTGDAILPKAVATKKAKPAKKIATKKVKPAKKAAAKVVAAAKSDDAPKPKKQGTIARQIELILKGLDNATIVAKVNKEFGSHTTPSCVSWARSQMRKNPKKYGLKSAAQVPASTPVVAK